MDQYIYSYERHDPSTKAKANQSAAPEAIIPGTARTHKVECAPYTPDESLSQSRRECHHINYGRKWMPVGNEDPKCHEERVADNPDPESDAKSSNHLITHHRVFDYTRDRQQH